MIRLKNLEEGEHPLDRRYDTMAVRITDDWMAVGTMTPKSPYMDVYNTKTRQGWRLSTEEPWQSSCRNSAVGTTIEALESFGVNNFHLVKMGDWTAIKFYAEESVVDRILDNGAIRVHSAG